MPPTLYDDSSDNHSAEPARITDITVSPRNPLRVTVKVNSRKVATLARQHVSELGLTVGQAWTDALADAVERASQYDRALQAAMTRLNRRAMSTYQLKQKLHSLRHDDDTIGRVTDKLTELGLLDDHAIGQAVIRATVSRKAAGPRLLREKLRAKGLSSVTIQQLIDQCAPGPEDSLTQATALVQTKLKTMARLEPVARKRRLWGLLARRGFDGNTIQQAIDKALQDQSTTT